MELRGFGLMVLHTLLLFLHVSFMYSRCEVFGEIPGI